MGKEATCLVRFGGHEWTGKVHLEETLLTVRGTPRVVVPLSRQADVSDGWLTVPGPDGSLSLDLGAEAPKWAHAIQNPKTLLDKLGLKGDQAIVAMGFGDHSWLGVLDFSTELPKPDSCDAIVYRVEQAEDLGEIEEFKLGLKPKGMLWIVFPRGSKNVTETQVFAAGKAAGLVDVKVCRFSETDTALKFVRPKTYL